jgi:ZIP family zinc transporter
MSDVLFAFLLTLFAGLATGVGGLIVLLAKDFNKKFLSICLAFSAGVMIYVSFVEIFSKALEHLEYRHGDERGMLFTVLAFFAGVGLIALIEKAVPRRESAVMENLASLKHTGIMTGVAIAIHNFPEGLVTFMAAMYDPALGVAIAIAIAIHNIPEGMAVAVPIHYATGSKKKAFLASLLSGVTEPIGALVGYFLLSSIFSYDVFGVSFGLVGGIMVFIAVHQLLPLAGRYGKHNQVILSLFAGMAVMAFSLIWL